MLTNEGNPVRGGGVCRDAPYQDPDIFCCWEERTMIGTGSMPCTGSDKRNISLNFKIVIDRFCADCDCKKADLGKYGKETMTEGGTDTSPTVEWDFNIHTICEVKSCKGSSDRDCTRGYPKTHGPFEFILLAPPIPGRGDPGYGGAWPPAMNEILGDRSHKYVKRRSDRPKDEDGEQLNPEWPTPKGPGAGLPVPPNPKGEDLPSTDGGMRCCPENENEGHEVEVKRSETRFCD